METLGQFLKREREFRNISLDSVSQATKINARFLHLIEQDRWEDLPRGAFVRGFLKGYSQYVGIPQDEVFKRLESQHPRDPMTVDPFRKFRGFEVKNRFFLFLVFAVVMILLAAYLSSR